MYQDELKDLEKVYKHTLVDLHKQLNSSLPELVDYMEEFVLLHRQTEAVNEKLEVLMAKTNRNNEEDKDEIYG